MKEVISTQTEVKEVISTQTTASCVVSLQASGNLSTGGSPTVSLHSSPDWTSPAPPDAHDQSSRTEELQTSNQADRRASSDEQGETNEEPTCPGRSLIAFNESRPDNGHDEEISGGDLVGGLHVPHPLNSAAAAAASAQGEGGSYYRCQERNLPSGSCRPEQAYSKQEPAGEPSAVQEKPCGKLSTVLYPEQKLSQTDATTVPVKRNQPNGEDLTARTEQEQLAVKPPIAHGEQEPPDVKQTTVSKEKHSDVAQLRASNGQEHSDGEPLEDETIEQEPSG